ncbi:MAG TPA: HDOD domain-containing protein [Marinobacter sp.]|nr:HDOD domain-containing protein [Marinobacter sp.]
MGGQESLSLRQLKAFQPLNRLTDDQLVLLASRAERCLFKAGKSIMKRGDRDGQEFFLLAGEVELTSEDDRHGRIAAGSERAQNPIARLQPRMYDVKAVKPCEFLVIAQDVLAQMLGRAPMSQEEMHASDGDQPSSEQQQLLLEFYSELRSNQVQLPSVPDVAWKVRRLVDREDTGADQVAMAISADPAMSAKLVRACNSPLYRGFNDVRNVRETVVRLGMKTTRQLVTVFAMRDVFKSRQSLLQKHMESLWQHSREMAALCWVLADEATEINPEEAMLAGLLHDIGVVPILVHAEHHPHLFNDENRLLAVIAELRADTGTGVLENWAFPAPFLEATRHAQDWGYASDQPQPQLVDLVIVAQMHAMIGSGQSEALPRFDQLPAYSRLGGLELNASRSLDLLTRARSRVDEVKQLLAIR